LLDKEAISLKYWRGFLTAGIFAAITWGLMNLGQRFTVLVDMIYPYITRILQDFLVTWTGEVSFCLWQVLLLLLIVIVMATIVLMIILRWNVVQWTGWVLACCSFIYMLHTLMFGLNYYAGPLSDDIRLSIMKPTTAELAEATIYYRDKANELADQVSRDSDGNVAFPDFDALALRAGEGFRVLTYDRSYSVFAGSTAPVKKLGWADLYSSMAIDGVTMGITGEAAVNPQIPAVSLPFVMCHEMSHRMSIAREGDANFAAFLATSFHPDVEFRYSAYFMAFRYCYNALVSTNTPNAVNAAARIKADIHANLLHDLDAYSAFYKAHRSELLTNVASNANDTYLKVSGNENGIQSYNEVTSLLVSWHWQEVVRPALESVKVPFDPFDEDQVDLSGIVNAPDKPSWWE
jgi:hypothetical protein